jgi:F-type H+-transporting ATPase subunit delta
MRNHRAAARYAEALFDIAREEDRVEAVRAELEELAQVVEATPDLRLLLRRPDLDAERKLGPLRAALGGKFTDTLMALVGGLVRHQRGDSVEAVAEVFGELADAAAGVVRAEAQTVVPLTAEQRARLVGALGRITGKKVELEERIAPEILAGLRLRVGDRLIDGSAVGRLQRMREELMNVQGWNR